MTTYPTPFGNGLSNLSATMPYLKAAGPTYHMGGLALGMPTHGLDSLQSHYSHGGEIQNQCSHFAVQNNAVEV